MELQVHLRTMDEKVKMGITSRENPELVIDYFPPFGEGAGYTSMELLVASLVSCLSTSIITLVRGKMNKTISSLKATAKGTMRNQHPKILTQIQINLIIESPDVEDAEIQKAITASEEKICPVWAILKGNTEVKVSYTIQRP